ncbi:hypothetical protein [Corynebacterium vitaeruminis]|uniref:hypothetical protein n=1 Tax=Corynebacterium vitaeruminis TaxID=38305 RepID=UPI0012DFAA3D|nr:hypothetical protein [Corynebacterium vitaeruminis]
MGDLDITTRLVLSRNARILLRPPHGIQFGTDSTRSGIALLPKHAIAPVAAALAACRMPATGLHGKLERAGLDEVAAATLIDDLLAHGILRVHQPPRPVAVVGASASSSILRTVLAETGIWVRSPSRGEPDGNFLNRLESDVPVVVIGFHALFAGRSVFLADRPTIIPARVEDGMVEVGPLRIDGEGPCPYCTDLAELRRDPEARVLRAQLGPSMRFDPLCEHLLAVKVAAVIHGLYSQTPAPGMHVERPRPGLLLRLSPYDGAVEERIVEPLALCPLCSSQDLLPIEDAP